MQKIGWLRDWAYVWNYVWNPSTCHCECDKMYKFGEQLDIRNCACKKCVIDNLVLTSEDKVYKETAIKVIHEKDHCLIHPIPLVIVFLFLLVVISIDCYYWDTQHWLKNNYISLHHY